MSYQVLARKWRPKNFQELQGQEHVSRALVNAIETERLHHAYLFTGTRGVGKTTIARILSKCLNCETNGLTATPCGECASCVEIDQGRFVDLIEVDAASRTKVDDTRELLENVQYRPTRGRYKVYLIDEVHMLSNSSFNALLKTLEEPPEHVIFLLATTDPQKLPVTVLSRCLQFHLKHMDEQTISNHLAFILGQEAIEFEQPALNLIAQSAEGSMRDGLSLLDQAIAFGQGKVQEEDIRSMLGTIDHQFMVKLLEALANKDTAQAINAIGEMSNYPVDFADALKELLSRLHQVAIYQATQVLLDNSASYVKDFAEHMNPEDVQLYYQLGLHARRDLTWAPSPKQGLEMALLRMLAFQIDNSKAAQAPQASEAKKKLEIKLEPQQKKTPVEVEDSPKVVVATSPVEPVAASLEKETLESDPVKSAPIEKESLEKEPSEPAKAEPIEAKESSKEQAQAESTNTPVEDDFADYQQMLNQDEDEQDFDLSSFIEHSQADEQAVSAPQQAPQEQASHAPKQANQKPKPTQNQVSDAEQLASLHQALGLTGVEDSQELLAEPIKETPKAEPIAAKANTKESDDSLLAGLQALSSSSVIEAELAEHGKVENIQESSLNNAVSEAPEDLQRAEAVAQQEVSQQAEQSADIELPWDPVTEPQDEVIKEAEQQAPVEQAVSPAIHAQEPAQLTPEPAEETPYQQPPEEPLPEVVALFPPCEVSQKWFDLVVALDLPGSYNHILQSSCVTWHTDSSISVVVIPNKEMLYTEQARQDIQIALDAYLKRPIAIEWLEGKASMETPAMIEERLAQERHKKACEDLYAHPFVQQLQQEYGARLDRNSIQYLD